MGLTPMMKQYFQIKEKNQDCIIFFRLGDFYEMFFEDAETASKELELVLTGRDCGLENRAPMCGIPYHSANSYITKLVSKGYKIAICEQLEDPSTTKGLVKRDVIKIITPGTYSDSSFLDDTKNNYIMSLYIKNNIMSMSFADVSTGDFQCTFSETNVTTLVNELSKYNPKEVILEEDINNDILNSIKERFEPSFTFRSTDYFKNDGEENLKQHFKNFTSIPSNDCLINSCNGLLKYILDTQRTSLKHIDTIDYYHIIDYMSIDINSRKNLELTETLKDKSKKGSLLWVIDKSSTAMGARLLRKWIEQPLINRMSIQKRLDSVEELVNKNFFYDDLKEQLINIYDIERLVGKVSSKSVNAKELLSLKNSISKIPKIKETLKNFNSDLLQEIYNGLDCLDDIYILLNNSIHDDASLSVKEGNIIKDGYNDNVDELRQAKSHGKEWIANLENTEKNITGIKSLKVRYNKIFGYYIEITKSNLNLVPEGRYIRKQTLANCERYITPELKEVEDKILGAQDKLVNLEYELFVKIRESIEKEIERMKHTSKLIAKIDCLCSLSIVALENNYCKPKINDLGEIHIEEGRHPVVEKVIPRENFVSNDSFINPTDKQLLLITGPNMAGKSTYMRQVALITILMQIGSFVPAKEASISICDKIFTRIGASDDLAGGKSTFMVEMWEVANILKNATNNSLVLLDEVGRGTSTYDGLSIAWSVIEHICSNKALKCKTLFATHYHELTSLEGKISGVKNYSIAVKKLENDIVFLRKIVEGGADESYGIEVAKLAGLPDEVIHRAKDILNSLEHNNSSAVINENYEHSNNNTCFIAEPKSTENLLKEEVAISETKVIDSHLSTKQIGFTDMEKDSLFKEITDIDILKMNPMEGFNKLYDIIEKAKSLK